MENEGYENLLRIKRENEKRQNDKYKDESKKRLKKIAAKKIQTTMIGALDIIEKRFGFLWDSDEFEDSAELKSIYNKARQEILDKGNNQIRNLETELDQYEIEWLRYNLSLPVKNRRKLDE